MKKQRRAVCMSNTLKKSSIFKRFYSELAEKYGKAKAKEIWDYAEEEFSRLKNAPSSSNGLCWKMDEKSLSPISSF